MQATAIDDTVKAEIIPTDLHALVLSVKKAQFAEHGNHESNTYAERMAALASRNPQTILQNDRLAREVVRAILTREYHEDPGWVDIQGGDSLQRGDYTTVFLEVPHEEVRERLWNLQSSGLLDVSMFLPGDQGVWCFSSEILISMDEKTADLGRRDSFVANVPLREAITRMLRPYETEQPMYTHLRANEFYT